MKIEKEKIQMGPLNFDQVKMNGKIIGQKQKQSLILSPLQIEMLGMMHQGQSVEGIVQSFLLKRVLISFIALADLIEFLLAENLILNPAFHSYFGGQEAEKEDQGFMQKIKSIFKTEEAPPQQVKEELKKLPFLRSLDPEILNVFLSHMRIINTPAGITVCQQGLWQRSLFVLLKGQAYVVKRKNAPKPRRIATLSEGSIFGEVGFFLGEPRTADVITETSCQIIRLKYQADIFDRMIEKETARNLQKRFWVIHSLLKSKAFQSIPDDCFDALLFAGELKTIPAETIIVRQGDPGETCYVVVQGSVIVTKDTKTVRLLGQGDTFGEVALMLNRGKRSATVKSQTETVVLEIPFDRFYQLLSHNLMLACEFEKIALQYTQGDPQRV
ncbi:MAG: cyclic nucleotide-binding domain-containing protein [Pseudobdellovibrionaceae bacterium]